MNNYFTNLRKTNSENLIQKPKENPQEKIQKASHEAGDINLNIQGRWGVVEQSVSSLKDIQVEQFISNNK